MKSRGLEGVAELVDDGKEDFMDPGMKGAIAAAI
jgi:hypothetical protein